MRVRGFEIVAVNFNELLQLERAINEIWEKLIKLPETVEIIHTSFSWNKGRPLEIFIEEGLGGHINLSIPDGSTAGCWSEILFLRFKSSVLGGNRFKIAKAGGRTEKDDGYFMLNLERV